MRTAISIGKIPFIAIHYFIDLFLFWLIYLFPRLLLTQSRWPIQCFFFFVSQMGILPINWNSLLQYSNWTLHMITATIPIHLSKPKYRKRLHFSRISLNSSRNHWNRYYTNGKIQFYIFFFFIKLAIFCRSIDIFSASKVWSLFYAIPQWIRYYYCSVSFRLTTSNVLHQIQNNKQRSSNVT